MLNYLLNVFFQIYIQKKHFQKLFVTCKSILISLECGENNLTPGRNWHYTFLFYIQQARPQFYLVLMNRAAVFPNSFNTNDPKVYLLTCFSLCFCNQKWVPLWLCKPLKFAPIRINLWSAEDLFHIKNIVKKTYYISSIKH